MFKTQCSDKNSFGNYANDMMKLKDVFKRCAATLEHHCEASRLYARPKI